ncbi:PAS domain-containing sensor histidine kinase [Pontibacter roseus]|uniref:PAS domain-containing sensor histidine kinase n=1 Tax=Pontibacter roseus TaxID=336989 RepID=UPI00037C70FC|nr:PAS domain-containing sensor histidine kinase [Pontibacter roseus]
MDETDDYEIFRKLISSINKVVFSYDVGAGSITFINNAFTKVWKRTRESIIANPALLLLSVHPDDRAYLANEYEELLHGILKQDIAFRILRPDKSVRSLLVSPQLIIKKDGTRHVAGLIDDVTVIRKNYQDLERHGAKKNSILEILSHDLAGPLANIQSLAELLSAETQGYKNREVDNIIGIIQRSSEQSIQLIREFVQQEFIESASVELFKSRVDLVEKMLEIVEQYKASEAKIRKEFRFSASGDKIYAPIDPNKFMQVINNLISNAIKFTHDGGIISIDLEEKDSTVLMTVQDNGIGIPERYHHQLFDKFTQARRDGLKGEPSTGLGMSIIKTIVEWHGGRIWFDSQENVGTTFYIEIPKE